MSRCLQDSICWCPNYISISNPSGLGLIVLLIKMPFPPIPANKDRCLGETQTGAYYLGAGEKTGVSWYWPYLMEGLEGQLVIPMLETTGLGAILLGSFCGSSWTNPIKMTLVSHVYLWVTVSVQPWAKEIFISTGPAAEIKRNDFQI